MKRWREVDALRGLMLVLMTFTHMPTRFSGPIGQPLGFVSAAEGFVFLSAFMAGYIFSRRALKNGMKSMCKAFLLRAAKLYGCHVAMLLYLFTIIAAIGITTDRQTIKNLISFYLDEPVTALTSSLALIYNPPLLDILPIYVAFMVLSPWILMFGLRVSWKPVIVASTIVWLCAQFGLEKEAYQAARDFAGLKVPFHEIGSFDVLAWQLVWLIGLWMGAKVAVEPTRLGKLPASLVYLALAVALTGFLTRHMFGQAPFGDHTSLLVLINKWHLGPLRLLNFMALLILTLRFGPNIKNAIRWRFLEVLGAASLPVFCVHLAVVLLALAFIGDKQVATPVWQEIILLAVTFLAMYGTAWVFRAEPQSGTAQEAGDPPAVSARVVR